MQRVSGASTSGKAVQGDPLLHRHHRLTGRWRRGKTAAMSRVSHPNMEVTNVNRNEEEKKGNKKTKEGEGGGGKTTIPTQLQKP